jgi:hypothetical protein
MRGVNFGEDMLPGVFEDLRQVAGHDQFVIMTIEADGEVTTMSPTEALVAVRDAIEAMQSSGTSGAPPAPSSDRP